MPVVSKQLEESEVLKNFGGVNRNNLSNLLASDDFDCDIDLSSYSPYVIQENVPDYIGDAKNNFSIFSLNCQSINAKYDKIKVVLEDFCSKKVQFSVLNFQESWLKSDPNNNNEVDLTHFELNGYKAYATGATSSSHGGVITYVMNIFESHIKLKFSSNNFDAIFIEIKGNGLKPSVVCNIYRPPRNDNRSISNFLNEFTPLITKICKENKNVFLTGDFNLDLIKANERDIYGEFLDLLLSLGLAPKISYPTRLAKYSASLLDLIFIKTDNNLLTKSKNGIMHSSLSDHFGCFTFLEILVKKIIQPKFIEIQNEDEHSIKLLTESLANSNLNVIIGRDVTTDPNITYAHIETEIHSQINRHLPVKKIKFNKYKHKKTPWITTGIITSMRFRDKLYRKFKSCPPSNPSFQIYKTNFNSYSKIINKLIKEAKCNYYSKEFDKYKSDMKKTWQTINSIMNRNRKVNNFPKYIDTPNGKVSDKQEMANKLNEYFTNIGQNLANSIPSSNKVSNDYLKTRILTAFSFDWVTPNEVTKIVNGYKPKTSKGNDGISMKLFKSIFPSLVNAITLLINQSLTTSIFPNKLKIAKIMPLLKKPNIYQLNNFRPISLLPCVSKLIEKCVFNQLYSYFESNNLLYKSQYGFRKSHSTESACLELVHKLTEQLENNETPFCIFIDLSKAFDTLNHDILLNKLKYYGLDTISLTWFRSYLSERKQYVEIDGKSSDTRTINTGVPQGSTLGPLLFIIYMNDLNTVSDIFKTILFADDTSLNSILSIFSNPHDIALSVNINSELDKINDWMRANKLSLNISKTKYMLFRYSQRSASTLPKLDLKIDNTNIEQVHYFDFLGIRISETLSWKDHISQLGTKLSKTIGVMSKIKNYVNSSILLKIYNSLILSRLHYGILCWGYDCHNIFKLQKKAIRIICNSRYNSHTDPLFKQLNLLKIEDIFKVQCLKFFYKFENNKVPVYFQESFTFNRTNHNYVTRHRENFQHNILNRQTSKKNLKNHLPKVLNGIPTCLLSKIYTHSLENFKDRLKIFYIDKYALSCERIRCYVCSR